MSILDWFVLLGTLAFIVGYGTWKTRKNKDIGDYLKGGNEMGWGTIGLSVMATQASAITFISTPGQAYESGMGFIQNYFGLPLAIIIISIVFIPIYYRLKVYTAYEYLENRFDIKSRLLAAFLFLVQRGLAAGITIYAPAIILSSALGWNLTLTIVMVGVLVVIYTVSGGTKAVSLTQKWQMMVIMLGMFIAFFIIIYRLPEYVSFIDAIKLAGKTGKLEIVNFSFDVSERYTFWTGMTGGLFLALSYFGTDQSQVQRYLSGSSIKQSRLGLLFNAMMKVPMQFFILFIGILVFVFFQFQEHPLLFNESLSNQIKQTEYIQDYEKLEVNYSVVYDLKKQSYKNMLEDIKSNSPRIVKSTEAVKKYYRQEKKLVAQAKTIAGLAVPGNSSKDSDYVFLRFIMNYMPIGIVGLLLAVIFSAAMSSTAGELNALGSTTTIDFYKRLIYKQGSEKHYVIASKLLTTLWGVIAILFALFAHLVENLIEAVNILGSIFYGTILGIFLVAFFLKKVKGNAVFYAALMAQTIVILSFVFNDNIAYLWYNVIGCGLVMLFSFVLSVFNKE